jgi:CMP-N-acetylneuraminic acid synthetase
MLTVKQEKFIQELVKGKSQRQAYKAAYNCRRMKERTIDKKASWLFNRDDIRGRYEELRKEAEKDAVLSAVEMRRKIIKKLSEIAFEDENDKFRSRQDQIRAMGMLSDLYALQAMTEQDDRTRIVMEGVPKEYTE